MNLGNIGTKIPSEAQSLAAISGVHHVELLNMSTEAGNVVVATKWPGSICRFFKNAHASAEATVIFTDKVAPTAEIPFPLDAKEFSGLLSEIHTFVQTGTSDNILVYLQKL